MSRRRDGRRGHVAGGYLIAQTREEVIAMKFPFLIVRLRRPVVIFVDQTLEGAASSHLFSEYVTAIVPMVVAALWAGDMFHSFSFFPSLIGLLIRIFKW
jgi:hypothetical protein